MLELPKKVTIREVGPRDGFQIEKEFIPTETKIEIINALADAGVPDIEATAFVSPKAVPQLRDAAEVISKIHRNDTVYSALVPNFKGAQNAVAAGVDEIVVVISASDAHNQANVRRTVDESLGDLDDIFSLAAEKSIPVICSAATASSECVSAGANLLRRRVLGCDDSVSNSPSRNACSSWRNTFALSAAPDIDGSSHPTVVCIQTQSPAYSYQLAHAV